MSALTTITRAFQRYGQPLTIINAGVNYTVQALLVPGDQGTVNTYFDGNESVGLIRPAITLFVGGSDPNANQLVNGTFNTDDFGPNPRGLVAIRKVQAFRISNVIVLYLCVCD